MIRKLLFGAVVVVAILALTMSAQAKTLSVGPDETYTTIQAALDAANDGDKISVKALSDGYPSFK